MASKVLELKQNYGEELTKLLNTSFEIRASAQHHEGQWSPELQEKLGPNEANRLRASEASVWADEQINKTRSRYVALELELRVAIDEALQSAERELSPQGVSTESVLMTTRMSEEELIAAMDSAAGLGDVGVETIKLCLAMARKKDGFDLAIDHALALLPDLRDAYDGTILAAQEPEPNDEPGEKFDIYAADSPSAEDILWTGGIHPMNLTAKMR